MRDSFVGLHALDFPKGLTWLNSQSISLSELHGKILLIDFWTHSCVNCIRTLPYVKKWHERYSKAGLVIIGVHTPEFEFEKDENNVSRIVRRFGIEYPVVLDNEYKIWSMYANRFWPRKLLVNQEGVVVYDHAGEGAYGRMEREIQGLLRRADSLIELPDILAKDGHEHGRLCYPATQEIYLGFLRGRVGNPQLHESGNGEVFRVPQAQKEHYWYLEGKWNLSSEYIEHARATKTYGDFVLLRFSASEVNLVAGAGEPILCELFFDGKPLAPSLRGKEVKEEGGRTFLRVGEPRMYRLISAQTPLRGTLAIGVKDVGARMYAFTFSGCV